MLAEAPRVVLGGLEVFLLGVQRVDLGPRVSDLLADRDLRAELLHELPIHLLDRGAQALHFLLEGPALLLQLPHLVVEHEAEALQVLLRLAQFTDVLVAQVDH